MVLGDHGEQDDDLVPLAPNGDAAVAEAPVGDAVRWAVGLLAIAVSQPPG